MSRTGEVPARIDSERVAVPVDGSNVVDTVSPEDEPVAPTSAIHTFFISGVLRSRTGRVGLVLLAAILIIAVAGPLLRPHDPGEVVGTPFTGPSGDALLGTDFLGRDVLSRFLSGGLLLTVLALTSTLAAYAVGITIGLLAGYRRGRPVDLTTVAVTDVFVSIPPIIFALLLVTGLGSGALIVGIAIAVVQIPPIVRLVRAFALSATGAEYVEAAIARGEKTWAILIREILPNLRVFVLADFGIRISWSIILIASLSFLGFGPAPPAADWGLMVSENRLGLTIEHLPVVVPALAIAALTISLNLIADALARAVGRTRGEAS